MNKPPETIYLQCYDEAGELLNFARDDATWCVDQINENDAVYVLAQVRQDELEMTSIHLERFDTASQRALAQVMRENRVKDECLEIAKRALEHYDRLGLAISKKALAQINKRLTELEPEERAE